MLDFHFSSKEDTTKLEKMITIFPLITSLGALILGVFAYSSYTYQSRYEAFSEYTSSLISSVFSMEVKFREYGFSETFQKSCQWSLPEDIKECAINKLKIYSITLEKLSELDAKFWKLDGFFYLNNTSDRKKIECSYSIIRSELYDVYGDMLKQVTKSGSSFQDFNKMTIENTEKLNKKIDVHLWFISSAIDPLYSFNRKIDLSDEDKTSPICNQ